jgi:hypothetical protein
MGIVTVKSSVGWVAETKIDRVDGTQLRIITRKSASGTIYTFASRFVVESGMATHVPFLDFSKVYMTSTGKCTEKKVATQQYQVLQRLDEIKADCNTFYSKISVDVVVK